MTNLGCSPIACISSLQNSRENRGPVESGINKDSASPTLQDIAIHKPPERAFSGNKDDLMLTSAKGYFHLSTSKQVQHRAIQAIISSTGFHTSARRTLRGITSPGRSTVMRGSRLGRTSRSSCCFHVPTAARSETPNPAADISDLLRLRNLSKMCA